SHDTAGICQPGDSGGGTAAGQPGGVGALTVTVCADPPTDPPVCRSDRLSRRSGGRAGLADVVDGSVVVPGEPLARRPRAVGNGWSGSGCRRAGA
ncbi:MAG: hypothetical protein ABI131_08200, partial [Nostocoides sp.]